MTPYEFGIKIAAGVDRGTQPLQPGPKPLTPALPKPTINKPAAQQLPVAPPKPVVPQTGPRQITMERVRAADAEAQARGYGGSVMGAFVSDPNDWEMHRQPSQAMQDTQARDQAELARRRNTPSAPLPHNPEYARMKETFSKLYPQFGAGDIQDMLQLNIQNRGGDLAQFIGNTQKMYKQNPTRAANYVPPMK